MQRCCCERSIQTKRLTIRIGRYPPEADGGTNITWAGFDCVPASVGFVEAGGLKFEVEQ